MYKKGAGNDKQGKDAGNRTLCPHRNFSQAIIYSTARAIQLINSLLYGKNEKFRTFTENLQTIFQKILFHEINPKSFSEGFLTIFKFSENFPKTHREYPKKIIAHEFYEMSFITFRSFPENLATILVNMRFQFCLVSESKISCDNFGQHAFSILFSIQIHRTEKPYPAL